MASSSERAVNFPIRVQGVGEAEADFKRVGKAGEESIAAIQRAAAAQAGYESALVKADSASAAFAAAQASANQALGTAKAQLKAGEISEQDYATAVLQTKNALSLVRAEYQGARKELQDASKAVVESRVAMNDQDDTLEKVTKNTGNARLAQLEWQHVMRATTGAVLAGIDPIQALTLEMGRIAEATQYSLGGSSKFAEFIRTPWGIALALGAGAAIQFGLSLLKSKDATGEALEELQKHAEKTRADEQAQQLFANTIDGLTQALDANRKAQEALNLVNDTAADKTRKVAEQERERAKGLIALTQAQLASAKAELHRLETTAPAPDAQTGQQGYQISRVAAQIAELQKTLGDADNALAEAERQIANAQTAQTVDKVTGSHEDRIRKDFQTRIDNARALAAAEIAGAEVIFKNEAAKQKFVDATNAALEKQVRGLQDASDAAVKAYQATQHVSNAQTGREITPEQAASIARAAGLQVNSSSRTYAEQKKLYDAWVAAGRPADNPVAMPGTSAHEGAKGRWALDIQFGQGVTPELLRKVFAEQGVQLTKVFAERGHFHVEGSRSQADSAAAAADRAADEEERRRQSYQNELAGLLGAELEARKALVTNPETLAAIERDEIETARKKYNANLASLVRQGKLTDDEADLLLQNNNELANLRQQRIAQVEAARKLAEAQAQAEREASYRQTQIGQEEALLHGQADLAETQDERRRIEHRLLELQFEQEKLQNDLLIAYAERLKALDGVDPQALARAEAAASEALLRNSTLAGRQAQATQQSDRQSAGPLEAYLAKQPHSAAAINERVQGYVVDELEAVRTGIDNAISAAIGVKDPLLAGLIDLLVQSVLIDPLAEILRQRAAAGAGGGGGGGFGGFLSKVLGLAGHAFGVLTAATASRLAPDVMANIAANPGLFASGTDSVPVGKPFWAGENGRELMRFTPSGGLQILSNQQSNRLLTGAPAAPSIGHLTINIPERVNPRRTASTVSRGVQSGISRAARKGLAF